MNELNILHISDLHFGIKSDNNKEIDRRQKEMLTSLIDTLCDKSIISNEWRPEIIAISGDIAWSGNIDEYKLYKSFFVKMVFEKLEIEADHIITCPGNHDIIRENVIEFSRPSFGQFEQDARPIVFDNIKRRKEHFKGYIEALCNDTPENICSVVNFNEWPWVYFITLNSAWDCRDNNDEGRLRVSLPILESLIDKIPENESNCVITLFHHPHILINDLEMNRNSRGEVTFKHRERNWLHIFERTGAIEGERCFASYVDQKSKFILNGHVHVETPPQYRDSAIQLICGTVYSNDTPEYHCRLLKIFETGESVYRDIRRKLGSTDEKWEVSGVKNFHLEPVSVKRRILEKKRREEEELRLELENANANYHKNKNGDELSRSVDNVIKKMYQGIEQMVHSDSVKLTEEKVNDHVMIDKTKKESQYKLINGEKNVRY